MISENIAIRRLMGVATRGSLGLLAGLPIPTEEELSRDVSLGLNEAKAKGREARFRLNIVAAYNYACALTGYRLTTITAGSIVDAAHIHQFADSRNNDPRNGLALCKNAHWLFDNGLWTLSDDYKECSNVTGRMWNGQARKKPNSDDRARH